jgi:hypothetical protein
MWDPSTNQLALLRAIRDGRWHDLDYVRIRCVRRTALALKAREALFFEGNRVKIASKGTALLVQYPEKP